MRVRVLPLFAALAIAATGLVMPTAAHAVPEAIAIDLDVPSSAEAVQDSRNAGAWTSGGWTNSTTEHAFVAAADSRDLQIRVGANLAAGNRIEAALYEGPVVDAETFGTEARYGTLVGSGAYVETVGANQYVDVALGDATAVTAGAAYVLVVKYLTADGGHEARWRYGPSAPGGPSLLVNRDGNSPTPFPMYVLDLAVLGAGDPVALANTGTAGDDGWFVGPVTSTYTCLDGTVDCPEVRETTEDGEHTFTGSVTLDSIDYAWTHALKVDQTPPTVTGALTELQEGDPEHGFRVTWTCEDATSGVVECPDDTVVTGFGEDVSASVEIADAAGNTATATVEDLVAGPFLPEITLVDSAADESTHAHGTTFDPTCTAVSTVPGAGGEDIICAVELDDVVNGDGSVTWTGTATAVDESAHGGTAVETRTWTVAAAPVVVTPTAPAPSSSPEPAPPATPSTETDEVETAPKTVIKVSGLSGLPKRAGVPVLEPGDSYRIKARITRDGNPLSGRPMWLHSVKSNAAGSKGEPTRELDDFTKAGKKGVWVKTFVPSYDYSGQFRTFGVQAKNGTVKHVTVYVS